MLKEDNVVEEENLFYYEQFKNHWNKTCSVFKEHFKRDKERKKNLGPVFVNRVSSHSLNYLRRCDNE